jgi:hypothetical protein
MAIDLDGLEAFIVHGSFQGETGADNNPFSHEVTRQLMRISNNSISNSSFHWGSFGPAVASATIRRFSADDLADHVLSERARLLNAGVISSNEPITLIGYSHGGNISIQAAKKLYANYHIKTNLITVSTPAYNSLFDVDSDNILFGDPEDPQGEKGIQNHIHIVHENDMVNIPAMAGSIYSNPSTKNVVIKESEVPLNGGIESHTGLPKNKEFAKFLIKIPNFKNEEKK